MFMYKQETLDSLRNARNKLYEIPGYTVAAMSLEDQEKHSDDMHRIVQNIMKIERINASGKNAELKKYGGQLQSAAANLERICNEESNFLLMIRSVNNGLGVLDEIVELLR